MTAARGAALGIPVTEETEAAAGQAIADSVMEKVRAQESVKPLLVEGTTPGRWILIDYGDFIVHVFTEECRRYYGLERLWGDAPNMTTEFTGEAEAPRNARRKKTS